MKLSYKIGSIIGLSIIGSLLVSAFIVTRSVRQSTESVINLDQQETALQTLDKVDRFLYERMIDVQIIATNSLLADALIQKTAASRVISKGALNNVKTFNGSWDNLALLDTSGTVLAATSDATSQEFFSDPVVKGLYDQAVQGHVVSSDVLIDSASGEPTIVYFAPIKPISQGQKVTGVMSGKVSWPAVLEILGTVDDADIRLINNHGLEIGSNSSDENHNLLQHDLSGQDIFKQIKKDSKEAGSLGIQKGLDSDGQFGISYASESGFLDYKGHGWFMVMSAPVSDIIGPSQKITTNLSLALGAIMLILLAVVMIFMNRQVIRPLKRLSLAVEGIAYGDWSHKVPVNSSDELGQLATSFNTMQSQLLLASEQLKHEKARLESSINSLPLGFILTDIRNSIITMNPQFHKMLGIKQDKQDSAEKPNMPIELLEIILDKCQQAINDKRFITYSYTTHEGRYLHMLISPIVENEKIIGAVALVDDVTEAKVLERSKDEFFSIASHELRTPLTAIRGNATLTQQFFGDKIKDPQFGEMLDDIHSSSIRLIEIVNDFLDASRLEQGKMEFKVDAFDVSKVVESVAYEMASIMKERNLYLKTDKTLSMVPRVEGDVNRVKQIVYNLTGNALKFTEKGGITVRAVEDGDYVRVLVEDTGSGIPADKQTLLFRKFQQAGVSIYTRDTTRGTGLGLYISKLLIEQMGGKLELNWSVEGKGSSFSFTLPIAKKIPS